MRSKNTLEYLGLWEQLNNTEFKGGEFDPLLKEAVSNSFTMNPKRYLLAKTYIKTNDFLHQKQIKFGRCVIKQ